jgi:hypothetical protein
VASIKRGWAKWKKIAHRVGTFQGRVILSVVYYVFVWPFGFGMRLFSDSLRTKKRPATWLEYSPEAADLKHARRQG